MHKQLFSIITVGSLITGSVAANAAPPQSEPAGIPEPAPLYLWYDKPAGSWETEALPLGNGFIGGMVFGGVERDRIQINEHTLWSGGPGKNENYDDDIFQVSRPENRPADMDRTSQEAKNAMQQLQESLQTRISAWREMGKSYINSNGSLVTTNYPDLTSPQKDLEQTLVGNKADFGSYQTLGDIYISDLTSSNPQARNILTTKDHPSNPSESVLMMFDGDISTKYFGGDNGQPPVTVTWDYNRSITVDYYTIYTGNDSPGRDPKTWVLYGSNDGVNFEAIDEQTDVLLTDERRAAQKFSISAPAAYQYYKLDVSATRGGEPIQLSEFEMHDINVTEAEYTDYARELDLNSSVAREHYELNGVTYNKEYFISNPGNVMVIRLTASKAGSLFREITVDSPQRNKTISAAGDTITMTGYPSDHQSTYADDKKLVFAQQIKVIPKGAGATLSTSDGAVKVEGADEILIIMSAGTNYVQCDDETFNYFSDKDPLIDVKSRVDAASGKTYEQLYKAHTDDYKELFDRVKLNLGSAPVPGKTTDRLLKDYLTENTKLEDRYLEMLYYQYGRYMLIASSRPGSLPANLQGIWADGLNPPWSSDYHTNINVQMNYWLAQQTNLAECHEPIIEYVKSLVPRGTLTAQYFHTNQNAEDPVNGEPVRGWTTYHENNIWGYTLPAVSGAFYFPAGAAWLCQDLWEQYAFSMDESILRDNYDTMLQAALFWVDTLWEDDDGYLVANPSWSPEHGPYSLGASCDQAIIWELFDMVEKASEILGKNTPEIAEIKEAKARLWMPEIGLGGQYMEWKDEITIDVTGDGGHRHVNHLFTLHPGTNVVAGRSAEDDEFVEAMKVTLNTRGDGGTGWSKAWKINFWARLRDGEHAGLMVNQILKESTYQNLFDAHPPFQIDGNFGATAGMTEMLVQSQGDSIDLMAAVPLMWDSGSVSGLKARGNFEVAMQWSGGNLQNASIQSQAGGLCKVSFPGSSVTVKTENGGDVNVTADPETGKISFDTVKGETYILTGFDSPERTLPNPVSILGNRLDNLYSDAIIEKTAMPAELNQKGAYVEKLKSGGLLWSLGLKDNDIIVGINGKAVSGSQYLLNAYNRIGSGEPVTLIVWSQDKYVQITFNKPETEEDTAADSQITLEAESYSEKGAISANRTGPANNGAEGQAGIGNIEGGDWVLYKNVNLETAPKSVIYRTAKASSGTTVITWRNGGPTGEILAEHAILPTGNWDVYTDLSYPLESNMQGTLDLCVTFTSSINLNYYVFSFYEIGEPEQWSGSIEQLEFEILEDEPVPPATTSVETAAVNPTETPAETENSTDAPTNTPAETSTETPSKAPEQTTTDDKTGGFPIVPVAIGAGAALILAAAGIFVYLKRK